MGQLVDFLLLLALWVLVIVVAFDGARRLAGSGLGRRAAVELGTAALASVLFGSIYFWVYRTEVQLIRAFEGNPYVQLPADWAKDKTAEARARGSRAYASAAFMGQGLLLDYVDSSGRWVRFQPSPQDIAERESAIVVRTRLEERAKVFRGLALQWWLGVAIAAAMGFLFGRDDKKRS